jgi:hypothetical protein
MPKNLRRITGISGVPPGGEEKPKRADLKDQRYISEGREKAESGIAEGCRGKMSARRHLKYYLKVYLIVNEHSNDFPHVLKSKWLAFGIRMRVFPKWKRSWKEGCIEPFGAGLEPV